MKIQVYVRNVYGRATIYPLCSVAAKFASLIGRKTLTVSDIRGIEGLGYTVEVCPDPEVSI